MIKMSSTVLELENEIKGLVKSGKVILGSKSSLKAIKLGKAKAVIVASKIPKELNDDVRYYAKLSNIPVIIYPKTSVELGLVCGKPFPVSIIAITDLSGSKLIDMLQQGGS